MRHLLRRPPRRRTGIRRAALAVTAFGASLLFLLCAAAAGLFIELRQGPIAFDLKPQIVAALDARVGHGYRFDLAGTAIEATDHGPALTIRSLSVSDASARPIVSAPSAAIAVDPLALMVGRIAPTRLDIHDVDLRLVIRPDGQVAVSAGSDEAAVPLTSALAGAPAPVPAGGAAPAPPAEDGTASAPPRPANAALRALSATLRTLVEAATAPDSAFNALERVNVTGRLVLDDRAHGTATVFSSAVLGFVRGADGGPVLTVSADGPAGRWTLSARAVAQADGSRLLTVEASDLSLDEITLAGGTRGLGFDFDMPVSARLAVRVAPDGDIASAAGTFSLGAGYFKLDDPDHEPLLIDAVAGGFHLDRATDGVVIDRTELRAGSSDFVLTGHVDLPRAPGEPWAAKIEASGTFGAERPGERPIRIARAGLGFRVLPAERRLILDGAEISGPEVDAAAAADIRDGPGGLRAHTSTTVRHMPAQTLVRLWPSFIAAPVRAWLLANLKGGTVESGTATTDLDDADFARMKAEKSVADGHLRIDFGVSNVQLAFMAGVPPLVDLAATGAVTGRSFEMAVQHGAMEVAAGRRLTLADGTLRIPDNDPKPMPANVEAHVTGGVDTLAELLSRDALKPYAGLPTEGAAVHGQIDGRLTVGFKIGKDVPADSTTVAATATATNFAIDRLIGKEGLTEATIRLDVDRAGLRAKGDGRLYGAPTTIELHKPQTGPGEAVIAAVLDEAARARAGVASASLKGPVAARVTAPLGGGERTRAAVELDFAKAGIEGPVPGFSKAPGRPARATLTVLQRDNGLTLDNFAFDGGGATLRGAIELDRDGGFASAKLAQVRLSPGDDVRVEAQQSGDVLKVSARGVNLDARPFLKWLSAPSPAGGGPDPAARGGLDLDLRTNILTGQNSQAVTGAELHLSRRAGQVKRLTLEGRLGRQPLTVTTSQIDDAPHFLVHAGDAGASLLFMDLYKRMAGGRLDANLVMLGPRLDGYATVHDFTVREDPAIRKLAVEGLESQKRGTADADAQAQGQGQTQGIDMSTTSFRKLEVSFTKSGNTVEVRDGSMFGPTLGATVAGTVDFSRDQVKLAGTFVPLFGVNNLFSQLPVLGPLLGGGRHEGLLGLSYRITGSATNPVLNVNPLSVLAPGFLRQIFGAFEASAQGSRPADSAVGDLPRLGQE